MVIDTSAVIAILFRESDTAPLVAAINQAPNLRMSAASVLEVSLVIDSRLGTAAADMLDHWLDGSPIEVVPVTQHQVRVARDGFRRFGEGRHPAALNYGDCFSYALAMVSDEELLFRGNDFGQTDVTPAL